MKNPSHRAQGPKKVVMGRGTLHSGMRDSGGDNGGIASKGCLSVPLEPPTGSNDEVIELAL
jgi:hypothetical protein